jgi:hypothetical protein
MQDDSQRVQVRVDYDLGEYKRVLRDFVPIYYSQTGKVPNRLLPWNWKIVEGAMFALFVPPVFWLKKAMIGECVFTFSADGLSRTSKGRTGTRTWQEVKAVHRLSEAYLVELKAGGAMPVPYRAFTATERVLFEKLAASVAPGAA